MNDTIETNQVTFIMINLSRGEIESREPTSEDWNNDVKCFGIKQSQSDIYSKKMDENELHSGELCQILDKSENITNVISIL